MALVRPMSRCVVIMFGLLCMNLWHCSFILNAFIITKIALEISFSLFILRDKRIPIQRKSTQDIFSSIFLMSVGWFLFKWNMLIFRSVNNIYKRTKFCYYVGIIPSSENQVICVSAYFVCRANLHVLRVTFLQS